MRFPSSAARICAVILGGVAGALRLDPERFAQVVKWILGLMRSAMSQVNRQPGTVPLGADSSEVWLVVAV